MDRILPARAAWPLYRAAGSRQIEAASIAAQRAAGSLPLMQLAGLAVARLALAVAPHATRVWVVAGPGNNGGDGLEAALQLKRLGKVVDVSLVGDAGRMPTDAAHALRRAQDAGVRIRSAGANGARLPAPADVVIDALLGLGGNRAPAGSMAELIATINAHSVVVAVDLPSGLDADGGQPLGKLAVRATHTLALLTLKPGLFTGAGRDHAGTVWLDSLNTAPHDLPPDAWLGIDPDLAIQRRHAQHKGSFGDVIVVGGAAGMAGAAVLATRAAHAAGAGRVWGCALDPDAAGMDLLRPELMWRYGMDAFDDDALGRSTVVCGCGGGDPVADTLPRLFDRVPRLVLDADALNAIARDPALQSLLHARTDREQLTVLTPHPLEAARLLGVDTAEVQADRLAAAEALAARHACIVVLKGSGSVVAAPSQVPRINASGNAALATAGTGDVLAGWLGGIWSVRAVSIEPAQTAFDAACFAVCTHGNAADDWPWPVLRAGDLIERLAMTAPR